MSTVSGNIPKLSGKQQLVAVLGVLVTIVVLVVFTAYTTASIFQKEPIADGTATISKVYFFEDDNPTLSVQSDGGGEQIPQGTFSLSIIDANGNKNSVTIDYETFQQVEEGGKLCFQDQQIINIGECS